MEPYEIIIPSRKRPRQAQNALTLLPGATVYVDEREADDYRPFIPAENLRLHRPTRTLPEVRNLIIEEFEAPVLVQVDDDLRGLRMMHNRGRGPNELIKDPELILDVIENGVQCAGDMDVGLFGWSRTFNTMAYVPYDPIGVVAAVFGTWGLRGRARRRRFDPSTFPRADVDFTLRALLEDRIVFVDRRFYFDHGAVYGQPGGANDMVSDDALVRATEIVQKRWGRYVDLKSASSARNPRSRTSTKSGIKMKVKRRSAIVSQ